MESTNPNIRINRIRYQIKNCEKRLNFIRNGVASMNANSALWYYLCDADGRNPTDIDDAKKELEIKARKIELELKLLNQKLEEEISEKCPAGKGIAFCNLFNN